METPHSSFIGATEVHEGGEAMGLHRLPLLGTVFFLVNVALAARTPQVFSTDRHIGRLPRSRNTNEVWEKEERTAGTSTVESLANALESTIDMKKLKKWLDNGQTTDDVFKHLTLNKLADDVLAKPQLDEWIEYMKMFNRKNPTEQTTLMKTLTSHFGDDGVARIIEAAKQVKSTEKLAKRLQFEQIQRWIGQQKDPKDVLTLLKLDQNRYDIFDKSELLTFAKYVDDWNKAYPDQQTTLFTRISPLLDEGTLADMLIKAKEVASTEKIAVRIQAEQTQTWLKAEKTPEDLFTVLKLNKDGDSLLENPILDAWMKYADDYREMYPKMSFDPIVAISEYYSVAAVAKMIAKAPKSSSIAQRLHTEQLRDWLNAKMSPARVFGLLELDDAGDKLFESPVILTWLKYAKLYSEKREKVSVTSLLKKRFGDEVLARILYDAQKVDETKDEATVLLTSLVGRWRNSRVHPDKVYKWLRVAEREETDSFKMFYERYAKAYADAYERAKARSS